MRRKTFYMATLAVVLLMGCSTSNYTLNPRQTTFSREDVLSMPDIQFPANYSAENFKDLKVAVSVKVEGRGAQGAIDIDPGLSRRLQGQVAELKRFTVYNLFVKDGLQQYEELQDVGDAKLAERVATIRPDYVLNVMVNLKEEKHRQTMHRGEVVQARGEMVFVVAECDANCIDLGTDTVYFSEKSRGRAFCGLKAGYDSNAEKKLAKARDVAAKNAIVEMCNRIGSYFPVGGKVTDVSPTGKSLQVDSGTDFGLGPAQQCVVFVRDEDVDIPLALAEAETGKRESKMVIYKWNDDDPDARPWIDLYRKNASAFVDDNDIYVVGWGLPPSKTLNH